MELLSGIHKHHVDLGGKDLFLYTIHGQKTILMDSGIVSTPETVLKAELEKIGSGLERIDIIVNTHADADHIGGNKAVADKSPHVQIMCHQLDVNMIQNPEELLVKRYDQFVPRHGIGYGPDIMFALKGMMPPQLPPVSVGLFGGESIYCNYEDKLDVLHTPGHTSGHISLYYPMQKLAFIGDAILGRGVPNRDGDLIAPPTYLDTDAYLDTIQLLDSLSLDYLLTCHYDVLKGSDIQTFLTQSRDWVIEFDQLLNTVLGIESTLWTMEALMKEIQREWNEYSFPLDYAYPIFAHMTKKVREGLYVEMEAGNKAGWMRL